MDGKIRRGVSSDASNASKAAKLGRIVDFRFGEPPGAQNMKLDNAATVWAPVYCFQNNLKDN